MVFDTNILVPYSWRAEFGQDNLLELLEGKANLVVSEAILAELQHVLGRPRMQRRHRWDATRIAAFVQKLRLDSLLVEPVHLLNVVRDPSDNRILEAAVAGHADFIVSKDRDLLDLQAYEGVQIVTPVQFLAILRDAV